MSASAKLDDSDETWESCAGAPTLGDNAEDTMTMVCHPQITV